MLGLEGGGLEAVDGRGVVIEGHHDDQATRLPQRVLHDAQSTARLIFVISRQRTSDTKRKQNDASITSGRAVKNIQARQRHAAAKSSHIIKQAVL